ncbi:hypothetical protein AKJ45_01805 [candidate division MSBL1 archaeon SCGC-AAA261F19]|uniref:HNH nuclease domain-containing protein n=2 Tax=candidate division MSBL1 TaxID=215777 RepID=A0A133UXX4_9EURY|nr:hypothetical protein AKJ42_03860 [candidate division MSBL1 archaeon SCGC-AAA261C02]KXB03372.1 hypothetical protein AKJ45_01805 [candidate division MSBL1 archaeon SCGC-AAA261F19]
MGRWSKEDKKAIAKANNQTDMLGNYYCKRCGERLSLKNLEVDHKKPKSKGGKDNPANLQLLCPNCNRRKGAKKPRLEERKRDSWVEEVSKDLLGSSSELDEDSKLI